METFKELEDNIRYINDVIEKDTNKTHIQLMSKLAVLEMGGWFEAYIEERGKDFSVAHSVMPYEVVNDFVEGNHGFRCSNFRKMIVFLIGEYGVYSLMLKVPNFVERYEKYTAGIVGDRGYGAHNPIGKSAVLFNAPSVYFENLQNAKKVVDEVFEYVNRFFYHIALDESLRAQRRGLDNA